jgi:hypothetical protein
LRTVRFAMKNPCEENDGRGWAPPALRRSGIDL